MDAGEARHARSFVEWLKLRHAQQLVKSLRFGGRCRCCLYFPKDSEAASAVMEESLDKGREKVTEPRLRQFDRNRSRKVASKSTYPRLGRGGQHVVLDLASQS